MGLNVSGFDQEISMPVFALQYCFGEVAYFHNGHWFWKMDHKQA